MATPVIDNEFSKRNDLLEACTLLGGKRILRTSPQSLLDVHQLLLDGLPAASICHLVDSLGGLAEADLLKVIGVSRRTLQKLRRDGRPLGAGASGQAWTVAYTFAVAAELLGGIDQAARWLSMPAPGLNQLRPIDLLTTPAGAAAVERHLRQVDRGIYT